MRIRPLLAVLSIALVGALGTASGASAAPPGPQPIIGGTTVSSAPWAAAVLSNGSFTCSGSVIAAQWVLTARHCISGTMSVRVGSVYRSSGGVTRTVSATYTRNDLALMRLSSTVSTSTVSLASSNPPINSTNSIYGWGMTCYSGCSASTQLKTATVRVTSNSVTDAYGGQAIRSTGSTATPGGVTRVARSSTTASRSASPPPPTGRASRTTAALRTTGPGSPRWPVSDG